VTGPGELVLRGGPWFGACDSAVVVSWWKGFGSRSKTPPLLAPIQKSHPSLHILRNTPQFLNMPPKGKKVQNQGKSGEEERDEPLQAVVRLATRPLAKLC